METPNNCQCYCYAIMSSLCFPCQVKVHLLHLTASPHGELMKNVRCQSPYEKTRSPNEGTERTRSPISTDRKASPDCDRCDYYMNFISNLTSGLCEQKLMREVCSNPCLITTDDPHAPGGAIISDYPKSKFATNHSNSKTILNDNGSSPPTKSSKKPPVSTSVANSITPKANTSKSSPGYSAKTLTAKVKPPIGTNNKLPITTPNTAFKQKPETGVDKRPPSPTELMTTDKILRRSFESIAKNRRFSNPSRSPSPAKKNPPDANCNLPKEEKNPINSKVVPKNYNKQTKAEQQNPVIPANLPSSVPKRMTGNEKPQQQTISKEAPNRKSKDSPVPGKRRSKDESMAKVAPLSTPVKEKDISNAQPGTERKIECNEEVCLFHPGMKHYVEDHQETNLMNDRGTKVEKGNVRGENVANGNALKGGFFEAALVMEFYQPPDVGVRKTTRDPEKRNLLNECKNELSTPDLGGGVVKEFCTRTSKSSGRRGSFNERGPSSSKQNSPQKTPRSSNVDDLSTMPKASVEIVPMAWKTTPSKNAKPSTQQKERTEDKPRLKSNRNEQPKQSKRNSKVNVPMTVERHKKGEMTEPVNRRRANDENAIVHQKDVWDNTKNSKIQEENTNWGEFDKRSSFKELSSLDKAWERFKEPVMTDSLIPQRSSSRRSAMDWSLSDRKPADLLRESEDSKNKARESISGRISNNKVSEGTFYSEYPKKERKNNMEPDGSNTPENVTPSNQKYSAPQGVSGNRRYSKDDREHVEQTQRKTSGSHGVNANHQNKSGKQSIDRECIEIDNLEAEINVRNQEKPNDDEECTTDNKRVSIHKDEEAQQNNRQFVGKGLYDGECEQTKDSGQKETKPSYDEEERKKYVRKSMSDSRSSYDDKQSGSHGQKKSKSPNRQRSNGSGTYGDEATKVYPQFSEYMNPNSEGYRSKSTGNVVDDHVDTVHRPGPDVDPSSKHEALSRADPSSKLKTDRGSSSWDCGVCPDADKRVYYHTNSEGKCTSMVIGLPDGRDSNPHIRINFNNQVKKEIHCYKLDKSEQKNDFRDTGTQYDGPDFTEGTSPNPSRPATARNSKNKFPAKTTAKPTQSSPSYDYGQMYFNRPLKRRSFL